MDLGLIGQILSSNYLSVNKFSRILLSIRETGGDWTDAQHGRQDPIVKGEKDPKSGPSIKIPDRDVGPSSTQVGFSHVIDNSLLQALSL